MTLKDLLEDEREEGRAEGFKKGCEQGSLAKAREMAKAMLLENIPIDIVSKVSGLSKAEMKNL